MIITIQGSDQINLSRSVINDNFSWLNDMATTRGANTVVLLGDSITANNTYVDATATKYNDFGFFTWANALLGQRLNLLNNAGVSGNTTTQMLARLSADVLAYSPSWCIVLAGINDIFAASSASAIWTNLKSIYEQLAAAGISVVAVTIPACEFYDATTVQVWSEVNYRIREYGRVAKNYYVADGAGAYVDTTSAIALSLTNYCSDGVHPSPLGAYALGRAVANTMDPLVPAVPALPYGVGDTSNIVLPSMMVGTGGFNNAGVTGDLATDWFSQRIGGSSHSIVVAKAARSDGFGEHQVMTLSGGTDWNTSGTIGYIIPSGYSVGDQLVATIEVVSVSTSCDLGLYAYDGSFNFLGGAYGPLGQSTQPINTATITNLVCRTPAFTIPSGTVNLLVTWTLHGISGSSTTGRVEVRKVAVL